MERRLETRPRPFQLWWYDIESKTDLPAGVAFYEEKYGEYRLKIDVHPNTVYFLRPISSQEKNVLYRVEVVIHREGQAVQRRMIGEGCSSPSTNGNIYIELGPYSKILIMEINKE